MLTCKNKGPTVIVKLISFDKETDVINHNWTRMREILNFTISVDDNSGPRDLSILSVRR